MATKTKTPSKTQTVIQINVYRHKDGKPQFLLFKRIDEDNDHFWQPISLAVKDDEPIDKTLEKAADQQAGITELHYLGQELYSYEWYSHGQRGRDIVFAAEVSTQTLVFPDLKSYTGFAWMPYKEALLKLTWDGNKKSLRQLMDHLEERDKERDKKGQAEQKRPQEAPPPEVVYEHRPTRDVHDELMPNYGDDEDNEGGRVFPL